MASRAQKILLGCGAGCAVAILLGVGSCVAFTAWLRAPGELLEAEILLDRDAVGYAAWRFDLDDPGTEAIVAAAIDALNRQSDSVELPGVLRMFVDMNNRRQARELRRMFPATAVWTLYPEGDDEDVNLYSVSIQRMGHQLVLADWALGFVKPWAPDLPAVDYRGETILSLEDEDDAGGDAFSLHAFLHAKGIFFADDLEGAKKAVDRLSADRVQLEEEAGFGRLENLYAGLDAGRPLRGVVDNRRGELVRLAARLEDGEPLDPELEQALSRADALVWSGGPIEAGDFVLDLLFATSDASNAAEIEPAIRRLVDSLDEVWVSGETPLETEVVQTARGVTVSLRLRDLAARISEWSVSDIDRGRVFEGIEDELRESPVVVPP